MDAPPPALPRDLDAAFAVPFVHRIRFTDDALDPRNPVLAEALRPDDGADGPTRVAVAIDDGLAAAQPDLAARLADYARRHADRFALVHEPAVLRGGEAAKQDRAVVDAVLRLVHEARICRRSVVLALGGGAFLDAVGFGAATAHRGVRLVRLPSTTLAQCDAAIGVKNGINAFGKKNFVGCFAPPWAVVIDRALLRTLADADWRSGLSEIVKVALLKDPALVARIERAAPALARRDADALAPLVERSAILHALHIAEGGDPFEMRSARPLDFGHWAAHRLEAMTAHALRHGEAVAIGLALDCRYAVRAGLLPDAVGTRILDLLRGLGFTLAHPALRRVEEVLGGLEEFREHLGGRLTITLLRDVGVPIDVHEIDRARMAAALADLGAAR